MGLIDRIILTIYTLCLALLSTVVILFSLKLINLNFIWTNINTLYGRWELLLTGIVFLVVSIRLLISGMRYKTGAEAVIRNTSLGQIRILLSAVETAVIRAAKDVAGVKDIKVKMLRNGDNINIVLKVSIMPDIGIPETTEDIQRNVKSYVEQIIGIKINEIKVVVEGISHEGKTRVS
jgi:uncharacterized alkaline shock family protein YloU